MKYSLKELNSFGVESYSSKLFLINSINDFHTIDYNIRQQEKIILGGGTNILLKSKFISIPIFKIQIQGIEICHEKDDEVLISVGAGVNWDEFVWWCVNKNFGGIENLVLIPGNVGSAPIQNIGAYGKEVNDVIHSCEGIFIKNLEKKTFKNPDCDFGYRSSIFKKELKNEFAITKVNFILKKSNHKIISNYSSVLSALKKRQISQPSIKDIAQIVKEIREKKLPDYNELGNAGSFFKNPIINIKKFERLCSRFDDIPYYEVNHNLIKVPAAWLIEMCGFKKTKFNNVGVHKNQSLVIINLGNAKGVDIFSFSQRIKESVYEKFDILLEEEVTVV